MLLLAISISTVSTNNASVQKDLIWPNTEDKFKKVSEIEKASEIKQVSLDSLNPTRAQSAGVFSPSIGHQK